MMLNRNWLIKTILWSALLLSTEEWKEKIGKFYLLQNHQYFIWHGVWALTENNNNNKVYLKNIRGMKKDKIDREENKIKSFDHWYGDNEEKYWCDRFLWVGKKFFLVWPTWFLFT